MSLLRSQRGNSLLEFAVVFPIYIAVVIGIINLAILLNDSIVAKAASRDAALAVSVTGEHARGVARGNETIETGGLAGTASLSVESPRYGIDRVKSIVTYNVPNLVPGIGALLGGKPWESTTKLQEESSYYVEYRNRTDYDKPSAECVCCKCNGGCD